ncbi:hypothetical protein PENTCL1PPCAC_9861 [Pristionchus entomophagus]|uniref:SHSP domain-containing protein n=1 Tax=Pristionchus entomophagus TaxID=358040 RepID=A0AAV5SWH1_9BILA|nr:hypothetical protein PENTCL1PPCAC_9861 [Pristionchus entomophagus]
MIDENGLWDWPLQENDCVVKNRDEKELFEVDLDDHFTSDEILVKVTDGTVDVHYEHEFDTKKGHTTESVTRSYPLPYGVDVGSVKTILSNHGTLVITAARKPAK